MTSQLADNLTLRIERTIRAPRERVFDAWTTPDEMNRFMAPAGMTVPEAYADVRVGGAMGATMVESNGTRHVMRGVYKEVTRPSRLVFTHAWLKDNGKNDELTPETIVTVEFHDVNGATRVVLTQTGFTDKGSRDGHTVGWNSTLDNLEKMF